jgi:hypothetical protein
MRRMTTFPAPAPLLKMIRNTDGRPATRSVDIVRSYQFLEGGFNYDQRGVKPRPVSFHR